MAEDDSNLPEPVDGEDITFADELPVLPIRNAVLFPGAVAPFDVGREKSVALVEDIENLTQAANIDIPVIGIGGSNGLTPVPGDFVAFAESIGSCAAPSCDGTPRVIDADDPSPAFPTLGGVAGGFEVYISEGLAHVDVVASEDDDQSQIYGPLVDFLIRNAQ